MICVVLSLSLISVFALAADFAGAFSGASGKAGDTVEIELTISNDKEIKSLAYTDLTFDKTALTFVSGSWNISAVMSDANESEGVLALSDAQAVNGKVLTLKFTINADATAGDYSITANIAADGNELTAAASAGKITVEAEQTITTTTTEPPKITDPTTTTEPPKSADPTTTTQPPQNGGNKGGNGGTTTSIPRTGDAGISTVVAVAVIALGAATVAIVSKKKNDD